MKEDITMDPDLNEEPEIDTLPPDGDNDVIDDDTVGTAPDTDEEADDPDEPIEPIASEDDE